MLALRGGLELCRELATKPLRPAGTTSSVSTAQAAEDAADNVEARFNAGLVARFAVGVAFKHRTRHLRMPHFRASSCLGYSHAIRDPGSWLRTSASPNLSHASGRYFSLRNPPAAAPPPKASFATWPSSPPQQIRQEEIDDDMMQRASTPHPRRLIKRSLLDICGICYLGWFCAGTWQHGTATINSVDGSKGLEREFGPNLAAVIAVGVGGEGAAVIIHTMTIRPVSSALCLSL